MDHGVSHSQREQWMKTNRIGRHWWFLAAGSFLRAGFVLSMTHDSVAQTEKSDKKADKKTKEKGEKGETTKAKKEKVEPPPSTFPKRVDVLAGGGGGQYVQLIDDEITKEWKKNNTYPSDRCTDYEFIRRASLDIIGRIPTVEEVKAFMSHTDQTPRPGLIKEPLQ